MINNRKNQVLVCILVILSVVKIDAQRGFYAEPKINFGHDTLISIDQVIQDPTGGYYAVGSIQKNTVKHFEHVSGVLFRLDCQGNLEWCRSISNHFDGAALYIDTNNKSYGYSKVLPLGNGNVLLLDNYNDNALTIFDNKGQVKVSKNLFYDEDSTAIFWDAKRISDDRFVVSGFSRKYQFDVFINPFIAVFDNDLNRLWSFTLTGLSFKRDIPNEIYNNISVIDDEIYTIYPLRDSFFVLHGMDINGKTLFIEKINDGNFFHNLGIFSSDSSLFITNVSQKTNVKRIDLYLSEINPINGRIRHSAKVIPKCKTCVFSINPTGSYNKERNNLHLMGYFNQGGNLHEYFGNPFYLSFDKDLELISAYKALNSYMNQTLDTIVLWNNFPYLEPDNDWSTPSIRYNPLNSSNTPFLHDTASFMMSRIPFNAVSCMEIEDITDSLIVRSVPFTQPAPLIEHRIKGPRMKDHKVRGGVIYPDVRSICYIAPDVRSEIVPEDSVFCSLSSLEFHSSPNIYNTEWYWYVDKKWVASDSVLMYLFESAGDYDIRLVAGDGCFYDTSTIVLHINPSDTVYSSTLLCLGDTLFVGRDSIFEEGEYTLLLQNGLGCDSVVFLSVELEDIQTELDSILCPGEIILFHGVSISKDTTVTLTLSSSNMCDSNVTVHFRYLPDCHKCELKMPRAFSPNGDGINDVVGLINPCDMKLSNFSFTLFNRWGERVFSSENYIYKWDGMYKKKPAPMGVYIYSIHTVLPNGSIFEKRGDITLIR